MADHAPGSLQDLMDGVPDLVDYFTNDTKAPHDKDNMSLSPIPAEYTNWYEEQRAWRNSVLLFDQCHHMPESFISGPDALRLLGEVGVNNLRNFGPLKARQYYAVNHNGYFIGECILQHLDDGRFELISGMHLQNWVQFNAETGGYDVEVVRDHQTSMNPRGRTFYRYQLDGPNAAAMFDELCDGGAPDMPFFSLARVRIRGHSALALRHSVAGHGGVELSGPADEGADMLRILLETGERHGLLRSGLKTYYSVQAEVGWVGYPTPAIYDDERMRAFREWLPATSWEARTQLGGSFRSSDIADYYVTPWDLGLEKRIDLSHAFIGRDALAQMANRRHRVKRMLVWDADDVTRIFRSRLEPGVPFKHMDMPKASYSFQQVDEVRAGAGQLVGVSGYVGYTANESKFLSVAFLDPDHADLGNELYVVWGEPDGGSRKPNVEPHRQTKVKTTVATAPYSSQVREMKNASLVHAQAG